MTSILLFRSSVALRLNALERLLSSGLLTDPQLIEQRNRLAEFRKWISFYFCSLPVPFGSVLKEY